MSSNAKLTAKLSDGTEWEILSTWRSMANERIRVVTMLPLKKEPGEFIISFMDGKIVSCEPFEEGAIYNRTICMKVREVVE